MAFKRKLSRQQKAKSDGPSGGSSDSTAADVADKEAAASAGPGASRSSNGYPPGDSGERSGANQNANISLKSSLSSGVNAYINPISLEELPGAIGFPVSPAKFLLMSIGTGFLYPIYWAYRSFRMLMPKGNMLLAAANALLLPFSFFLLIIKTKNLALQSGISVDIKTARLAVSFFVLHIIHRLFLSDRLFLEAFFLGTMSILPLYKVQKQIVDLNAQLRPEVKQEEKFSPLDKVGVLVFGAFMLLGIIKEMMRKHWIPAIF